jgi:hypothetical protein
VAKRIYEMSNFDPGEFEDDVESLRILNDAALHTLRELPDETIDDKSAITRLVRKTLKDSEFNNKAADWLEAHPEVKREMIELSRTPRMKLAKKLIKCFGESYPTWAYHILSAPNGDTDNDDDDIDENDNDADDFDDADFDDDGADALDISQPLDGVNKKGGGVEPSALDEVEASVRRKRYSNFIYNVEFISSHLQGCA